MGSKSTGADLAIKIERVICALYSRGFVVCQVAIDGASENISAFKLLDTHKVGDVFTDLNTELPQDTLVAFKNPSGTDNFVFIGGEMPHWVKRVVNGLEN